MSRVKGFSDTIQWYEKNASNYAQAIGDLANPELIEEFSDNVNSGGRVLDAGCAAGRDSNLLSKKGFQVTGVDLSKNLLKIARQKYPDIEFIHANFLNLPFRDETFDGVWANASLLHLESTEDVERAISEFYRVLSNMGVLHVSVKQQLTDDKYSVVSDSLSNHDRFFQWFTKQEISDLLKKNGFKMIKIVEDHADPGSRSEVKWIRSLSRKVALNE